MNAGKIPRVGVRIAFALVCFFTCNETHAADPNTNLIANGDFSAGLAGWSVWNERGSVNVSTSNGQLQIASNNHNGGVYQQFATGGAGTSLRLDGFWATSPTVPRGQWVEVLLIHGARLPVDGRDVTGNDPDVTVVYKSDTFSSTGGWSGTMSQTNATGVGSPVIAASDVAALVLKSGNLGTALSGARFDDIRVESNASPPPSPPPSDNILFNGNFSSGLDGWTRWTERGNTNANVEQGQLQMQSGNHNGGIYQSFATGGAGTLLKVDGFWASHPTVAARQWAEVIVIHGGRTPADGQDLTGDEPDAEILYKNSTWTTPSGWSGTLSDTAAVTSRSSFTAVGEVATLVLKSGNLPGPTTGTRFDDLEVSVAASPPPPPPGSNAPPVADVSAIPARGEAPLRVSFDAGGSFDPDGDALSYHWDFGGVGTNSGESVVFTYVNPGTYSATLTLDDGNGGEASASVTIEVTSGSPPAGPNRVVNPGFEGAFTSGLATGWQPWKTLGGGYWKRSSRLGRIGSGSYGSGAQVLVAVKRLHPKIILLEGNALGMAAELKATFPDALMIGRLFVDHLTSRYLTAPERYGREHAENCIATNRAEIEVWQGLNEPFVNDVEQARRVARFEKAFSDRLQELGKKSVVLNLAVGNPGDMENMLLPEVVELLETADYAGYHTYGGNEDLVLIGPQRPWFAHRWRFYADMYEARGLRMPPVLYTEVNTFYQWKAGHTPPGVEPLEPWEFRDDLIAFEVESRTDPWAVGMAIFLIGSSSPKWDGREIKNEPVVYEGAGAHNWNHPADARGGVFSQQFGAGGELFRGGVVQRVSVDPGSTYQLASSIKLEAPRPRSSISIRVGYDLTGQLESGDAPTITWSTELVDAQSRETDIWYEHALTLTSRGDAVSIWFEGSQRAGADPFRISLDEVKLERLAP